MRIFIGITPLSFFFIVVALAIMISALFLGAGKALVLVLFTRQWSKLFSGWMLMLAGGLAMLIWGIIK